MRADDKKIRNQT